MFPTYVVNSVKKNNNNKKTNLNTLDIIIYIYIFTIPTVQEPASLGLVDVVGVGDNEIASLFYIALWDHLHPGYGL